MRRARVPAVLTAAALAAVLAVPAGAGREAADARAAEVAIFYYPWYANPARDGHWAHWFVEREGRMVLSTPFYPRRGLYSSSSRRVVAEHMREIRAAGVTTVVSSWWGPGSAEANRLPLVKEMARRNGLEVAIHLEPYQGRTPARTAADIARLRAEGYTDFYLYEPERHPETEWAEALAGVQGVRVIGHTTLVGRAKASGFHGLYTYDVVTWRGSLFRRLCAQARKAGLLCAPSVGPGYDARLATRDVSLRPRVDGLTYDRMWKCAIRSGADIVTVTSYNEWQEGTQIEPARSHVAGRGYDGAWGRRGFAAQNAYLDATALWAARFAAKRRQ